MKDGAPLKALLRNIANVLVSVTAALIGPGIYTVIGFGILEVKNTVFAVTALFILLVVLLLVAYILGKKLLKRTKCRFFTVVVLPLLLLLLLFGLGFCGVPFIAYLIQYPAIIWMEALNWNILEPPMLYYLLDIMFYFTFFMTMLIGSYRKKKLPVTSKP